VLPLIKDLGDRIKDEVKVRAELRGENPPQALAHLERNLESFREHLSKRRRYLLDQPELKAAPKFDRNELK